MSNEGASPAGSNGDSEDDQVVIHRSELQESGGEEDSSVDEAFDSDDGDQVEEVNDADSQQDNDESESGEEYEEDVDAEVGDDEVDSKVDSESDREEEGSDNESDNQSVTRQPSAPVNSAGVKRDRSNSEGSVASEEEDYSKRCRPSER